MQSRNAIGNLVSRYRAVLKKCNIMNVFGSLAVAGMLATGAVAGSVLIESAVGSVSVAQAAPVTDGVLADGDNEIAAATGALTAEDVAANVTDGKATGLTDLTITAKAAVTSVTFKDNVALTGAVNLTGADGTNAASLITTADKTLTVGGLTTVGAFSTLTNNGTYNAKDITVSGATSALINATTGIINAGNIIIGTGGILTNSAPATAEGTANFTANNLTIASDAAAGSKLGVLDVSNTLTLNQAYTAGADDKINLNTLAGTGDLTITAGTVDFNNGTVGTDITLSSADTVDKQDIIFTSGNLSAGTVSFDSKFNNTYDGAGLLNVNALGLTKAFTIGGAALTTVEVNAVAGKDFLSGQKLTVAGDSAVATLTLSADGATTGFTNGTIVLAGTDATKSILDVTAGAAAGDAATYTVANLDVTKGTVNVTGTVSGAASLTVTNLKDSADAIYNIGGSNNIGTLNIGNADFVPTGKFQITELGVLEVNNATLAGTQFAATGVAGTIGMSGGELKAKNLTLTADDSNAVTVGDMAGTITAASLTVGNAKTEGAASLTVSNGTIKVTESLNVADTAIADKVRQLTLAAALELNSTSTGKINVDNLIIGSGGKLDVNGGSWIAKAIENNGTSAIAEGATLSVASLNAKAEALTVGGTLDITGTKLGALQNASSGLAITGGTLKVADAVLGAFSGSAFTLSVADGSSVAQMEISANGTLHIKNSKEYTIAELKSILTATDTSGGGAFVSADKMSTDGILVSGSTHVDGGKLEGTNINFVTTNGGANSTVQFSGDSASGANFTANAIHTASGDATGFTFSSGNVALVGNGGALLTGGKGDIALTIGVDGKLTLQGGSGTLGAVSTTGTGTFGVQGGNYEIGNLTLASGSTVAGGGTLTTAAITGTASATSTINVGNEASKGTLIATSVTKATIFADPEWTDGTNTIDGASSVLIGKVGADTKLIAGQNSFIAVGTDGAKGPIVTADWMKDAIADAGIIWGNALDSVGAAFGIYGTNLALADNTSGIAVGSEYNTTAGSTVTANQANFAADSLLVIDGGIATSTGKGALTGTTGFAINAVDGAKLLITDVQLDKTTGTADIVVASGAISGIVEGAWGNGAEDAIDKDTLLFDSIFYAATSAGADADKDTDYVVGVKQVKAVDALGPNLDNSLGALIDKGILGNVDSKGMDFVKAASKKADGAVAIEGGAKMAVAGGAMASVGNIANVATVNVGNRTSLIASSSMAATDSTYVAASGAVMSDGDSMYIAEASTGSMENGIGLWVMPMYQNTNSDGFESGAYEYGYDSDLFGASIGADYTFGNSLRVGAAFHLGSGDSDSTGDFASTENDFDYYGFSLYSGYMIGNLGLSADLGYTQSSNDVTQSSNVGQLKSEFDADVITAGLRAEYKVSSSMLDIIPHLGLRLNYTDVESYSTKYAGGTAFHTDSSDSTTFAIPVGVTLQKDIETASGILLTPSVDLGVQFTMGDLDVDQDVRISGVNGSASMESEIFDAVTFQGGLGLGVKKDNLGFDLDYKINASSNVVSQGVMGTFRYEF